ncbi:sodium channel protein 1 brain-like [Acanthaster planci]|uniref:Sodium channel protein n=1 Tax=Acanthaster planci TaxID=133434 RepID=A0A8B7ZRV7_ACAPL|nr:sodium channel protein 1 brain-like [Acanthaster planci]
MPNDDSNPNFRRLTKESLRKLELRHNGPKPERAFSRLSLMSDPEEDEEALATGKVYDTDLLEGKPLPDHLGTFPKSLYGKPIEELDAVRQDERTFCLVGRRFGKTNLFRFSSTKSLHLLTPLNPLRKAMLFLLTNQFFDVLVILTILVNCGFLAMDAPRFDSSDEIVFTAIYSTEMIVKIIARGFVLQKHTYLRDPWNWLDFSVILLAYVTFFLGFLNVPVGNLSGLRTFRVLRALKTISVIPGLKSIINALLRSLKMLGEVLLLTFFGLAIFALLSLQLYMGVLHNKCVVDYNITVFNDTEEDWYNFVQNSTNWYYWDGEPRVCSNISGPGPCPENYTCLKDIGPNPNGGYTGFDNIGMSLLTCFQVVTLDFWEDVYNLIIRATGPLSMLFFFITVMFGSFYLVNLMLAVVSLAYTEEMENQGKEKALKAQQIRENVLSMDAEKLKKLAEKKRKRKERREKLRQLQLKQLQENDAGQISQSNQAFVDIEKMDNGSDSTSKVSQKTEGGDATEESPDTSKEESKSQADNDDDENMTIQNPDETDDGSNEPVPCCPRQKRCRRCLIPRSVYRAYKKLQYYAALFVLDPVMDLFITFCILLNTAFLAMDHHMISSTWETVLDIGNRVFTAIFTIECVLKLISLNAKFFKTGWNIFDLIIVVCSLVELGLQGVQGLSILRTFRLLRVLKLAQSWTTMRMLISIIGNTMGALGNVSFVLLIIVYIFAIMGMQLLGKNYTEEFFGEGNLPRWHFRDFTHSLLLIFRILCGEWIEPLYDCMDCSDQATCILIFTSSYMVGNVMILNLFLALLLNSFASDTLQKEETEETRLGQGVAKVKRWAKALFRMCCCKFRRSTKVGVEEKEMKDSKLNETNVTGVELEPVSSRRNTLVAVLPYQNGSIHNGSINGSVHGMPRNGSIHTSRAASPFTTTNTLIPNGNYLEAGSRNGSAVSLRHRPTSHTALSSSVVNSNDKTCERPGITVVNNTDSETGEEETARVVQGSMLIVQSRPTSSMQKDALVEVGIIEDPVHDCCPQVCTAFCSRKCPCTFYRSPESSASYSVWRRFRELVCTVVENRFFEWFILLIILVSTITLVFEDIHLPSNPGMQEVLAICNVVFAIIFVIEMLLKWIAIGYVKYFTNFWCWLDFVIVVIAIMSLILDAVGLSGIGAFRALRTLRALRPLRAISRWQGIKIVVNALAHAIPAIVNVVLVCVVFWLIFSIMGVQFFKGTFSKCVDEDGNKISIDVVNNFSDCISLNYTWESNKINFDNVMNGYLALFQVATFEGWQEVIEDAVDNRGVDMQPHFEASLISYVFFVIFIFFGSFFTLNLFIGVIIENFNQLKRKYEGDSSFGLFLTSNQKNYYQTMRRIGNQKPTKQIKQPTNKIQAFFFKLTSNTKFEMFIVFVILCNMITMSVDHYKQSQEVTRILDALNIVFTSIFTLEMILKLIGLRLHYFRVPWNIFDFIVVTLSILGIILSDILTDLINPTLLRVLRLFRIGRVLRLVKAAKGIRKLLFALAVSMPALINIGALLFLVIFIFAIIGMSQFAYVKHDGALDDVVNFETWINSMLLLFRLSTSAGWNDVLYPLMTAPPECDDTYMGYPNGNCGSYIFASLFFFIFLTINFLMIINMYIAVILENFSQAHALEEVGITEDDFGMFYQVWQRFDPNATQFIMYDQLSDFCDALEQPLRLEKPNNIKIAGLELPIYDDIKLHCLDVLFALTKRVIGDVEESDEFKELQKSMQEKFQDSFPDRTKSEPTTTTLQIKKRGTAAKKIQRAFRRYRLMVEMRKASTAYRAKQSMEGSRRNSESQTLDLDCSINSQTFGQTLTVPAQTGLNRSRTPTIPEDCSNAHSDKRDVTVYRVEDTEDDVPTIDATVEIVGSSSLPEERDSNI